MTLAQYLEVTGETVTQFSKRCPVTRRTLSDVYNGYFCGAVNAMHIIEASESRPGPNGERVTLRALCGVDA